MTTLRGRTSVDAKPVDEEDAVGAVSAGATADSRAGRLVGLALVRDAEVQVVPRVEATRITGH